MRNFYDELWAIWLGPNGSRLESQLSRPYMQVQHAYEKYLRKLITSSLREGMWILDIGCGVANNLSKLSSVKKDAEFFGLDLSLLALKHAVKKSAGAHTNCHFVCASAQKLPLRGECFGIIILSEVIEHFGREQQFAILRGVVRVLRSNGILALTTPNKSRLTPIIVVPDILRKVIKGIVKRRVSIYSEVETLYNKYERVEHIAEFSPVELKRTLEYAGLKVEYLCGDVILPPLEHLFDLHKLYQLAWRSLNKLVAFLPNNYWFTRGMIAICRRIT